MSMTKDLAVVETNGLTNSVTNRQGHLSFFSDSEAFATGQRMASMLAKSQLVPKIFQNNIPDTVIALELAQRIGASPLMIMQSLYIVHGKPSFSASFIIAALNASGRISPLRFDLSAPMEKSLPDGKKYMDRTCTAWAIERGSGERLEGPPVSIEMARREGWFEKSGSKWQTMPELMLRYRAATFFGRLYAPDILMGMRAQEELMDAPEAELIEAPLVSVDDLNARFTAEVVDTQTGEIISPETPSGAIDPTVKKFMAEIDEERTSLRVDQWRAQSHKRLVKVFGGEDTDGYRAVIDYAEVRYNELRESEGKQ